MGHYSTEDVRSSPLLKNPSPSPSSSLRFWYSFNLSRSYILLTIPIDTFTHNHSKCNSLCMFWSSILLFLLKLKLIVLILYKCLLGPSLHIVWYKSLSSNDESSVQFLSLSKVSVVCIHSSFRLHVSTYLFLWLYLFPIILSQSFSSISLRLSHLGLLYFSR